MPRRLLSIALALSTMLAADRARAEASTEARAVLVIGGGGQFRDAMTVALSPWQLRVVPLEMPPPRPVMPRAADEARALAQQWGATGLVWVAMDQNEPSLWVYDASTDQIVTRRIASPPPFDAPTAAAAALSVKTLLRASTVAPAEERIGASATSSSRGAAEGRAALGAGTTSPDRPSGTEPVTAPALLRAELEVDGRTIASAIDTRVAAGASVWLGPERRLGLAVAASFGPGLSVSEAQFAGRFSEIAVAPSLRYRLPLARRLVLEPRLGTSLHATTIDGVAVVAARPASSSRLDGSVDAALALELLVTPAVGLALDGGVSAMLRYQRYLVESDSVFELRPVQGFLGLRLTTSLL